MTADPLATAGPFYVGIVMIMGAIATVLTALSRFRRRPDNRKEFLALEEESEELKVTIHEAISLLGDIREVVSRSDERIKGLERRCETLERDLDALQARVNRRFDGGKF